MTIPLWLEDKYLSLVSFRLERYRRVDRAHNFRCPFCGDSSRNRFKARAYMFESKGHLRFFCHNCGASRTFSNFLKDVDPSLYGEFRMELLKENGRLVPEREKRRDGDEQARAPEGRPDPLRSLRRIDKFEPEHPVRRYMASRMIPEDRLSTLYYATRFMEWVNTELPGKFTPSQLSNDEPRLIIPFRGDDGQVFAVTGRSFRRDSTIKYLTVKFDEDRDKVFGMDTVDRDRRVYIVEGPIDSFFLENSIAFAGSSGAIPDFPDSVIVLDNEPRNREIVRLIEKFIDQGRKVCIWPPGMSEKDINDLVVSGKTSEEIKHIIDNNTYSGLTARVRFSEWKVV